MEAVRKWNIVMSKQCKDSWRIWSECRAARAATLVIDSRRGTGESSLHRGIKRRRQRAQCSGLTLTPAALSLERGGGGLQQVGGIVGRCEC